MRPRVGVATGAVALTAGVGAVTAYGRAMRAQPEWHPPVRDTRRAGALAVGVTGSGPPVLLLHGLLGSGRFWSGAYDAMAATNRVIVPDLLGFGRSDRPGPGHFGPDDHADAVADALEALGLTEPAIVGAHSLGTIVALRLAARHPDRVVRICAFGPPLYPDRDTATRRIAGSGPMARAFGLPGPFAEWTCRWVCAHRTTAAVLSRWANPGLPPAVASDAVEHTWPSYAETVERCLLDAEPEAWVREAAVPVRFVSGREDSVVDHAFLERLAADHGHVTTEVWPGDHRLPMTATAATLRAISQPVPPTS